LGSSPEAGASPQVLPGCRAPSRSR
jgi:hypothetical protein